MAGAGWSMTRSDGPKSARRIHCLDNLPIMSYVKRYLHILEVLAIASAPSVSLSTPSPDSSTLAETVKNALKPPST